MKKFSHILQIGLWGTVGGFIGSSVFQYYDYRTHPALYEMQSAPWYFRVVVQGIGLVILVIIFLIAMRMVKKKIP